MSKAIKVIDLLNKIANGEEVPKNIRFEGVDLRLENDTYYRTNTLYSLIDYIKLKRSSLNEEVEIIEEEPEIDIQEIDKIRIELDNNGIASKIINQLVQAVKQLNKKINKK